MTQDRAGQCGSIALLTYPASSFSAALVKVVLWNGPVCVLLFLFISSLSDRPELMAAVSLPELNVVFNFVFTYIRNKKPVGVFFPASL